jgi:hypothetical protein
MSDIVSSADPDALDACFPRYVEFDPAVPVWCVTPSRGGAIHRFFDSSPISPSGRYLGLTRIPREDRLPEPGDLAEVLLVDLVTGVGRTVEQTAGWDTQVGAHVQWGVDDRELFFNVMDTGSWLVHGVKLNPATGERQDLDGPVYSVSPDGTRAASACLRRIGWVQPGYGVTMPADQRPRNRGAVADDGIYVTDTNSGRCSLVISFAELLSACQPQLRTVPEGDVYGFHVRWNRDGGRLQVVLCWVNAEARTERGLITMRADGSDVRVAVDPGLWGRGVNHPSWCPDGSHVLMNLRSRQEGLRFGQVKYDGSDLRVLHDQIAGSGHPSMHADGHHILTDSYPDQLQHFGDGSVPLRLVDLVRGQEETVARMRAVPAFSGPKRELRVDLHPAWDRMYRLVTFNGCPDGTRRVFVADLGGALR